MKEVISRSRHSAVLTLRLVLSEGTWISGTLFTCRASNKNMQFATHSSQYSTICQIPLWKSGMPCILRCFFCVEIACEPSLQNKTKNLKQALTRLSRMVRLYRVFGDF